MGNQAFMNQSYFVAQRYYTEAVAATLPSVVSIKADLVRDRAQARLSLMQFDAALSDAEDSIRLTSGFEELDSRASAVNDKARFRAATAAYHLGRFVKADNLLNQVESGDKAAITLRKLVALWLLEQNSGKYNFPLIRRMMGNTGKADTASFAKNTETRATETRATPDLGRGHGVFSTVTINTGDIVSCEKVYSITDSPGTDRKADLFTATSEDTVSKGIHRKYNVARWKNTVAKAIRSPSTICEVLDLDSDQYERCSRGKELDVFLATR